MFAQNELIDIISSDGKPTGKSALKSVIHTKGYYHNTAHVWFYTEKGNILLAQRAASKSICPLLWDVSVAGHVDAGETIETAAIRETKEELGITISEKDLLKIDIFECCASYENGIIDNEFHHTYISKLNVEIDTIKFDTTEVEAVKLVSISEFKTLLKNSDQNSHFVASNYKYYQVILEEVQKCINSSVL